MLLPNLSRLTLVPTGVIANAALNTGAEEFTRPTPGMFFEKLPENVDAHFGEQDEFRESPHNIFIAKDRQYAIAVLTASDLAAAHPTLARAFGLRVRWLATKIPPTGGKEGSGATSTVKDFETDDKETGSKIIGTQMPLEDFEACLSIGVGDQGFENLRAGFPIHVYFQPESDDFVYIGAYRESLDSQKGRRVLALATDINGFNITKRIGKDNATAAHSNLINLATALGTFVQNSAHARMFDY